MKRELAGDAGALLRERSRASAASRSRRNRRPASRARRARIDAPVGAQPPQRIVQSDGGTWNRVCPASISEAEVRSVPASVGMTLYVAANVWPGLSGAR